MTNPDHYTVEFLENSLEKGSMRMIIMEAPIWVGLCVARRGRLWGHPELALGSYPH